MRLRSYSCLSEDVAIPWHVPYAEPRSAPATRSRFSGLRARDEENCDERKEFRGTATNRWKSGDLVAQFTDRSIRVSGRAGRVLELARRTARLARNRGSLRPVPSHGECVCGGSRRAQIVLSSGNQ